MTSTDFYATMLDKAILGQEGGNLGDRGVSILGRRVDKDRVFLGEDARVKDSPQFACSAVVSTIDEWVGSDYPEGLSKPWRMTMLNYVQGCAQGGMPHRLHAYRQGPSQQRAVNGFGTRETLCPLSCLA